MTKKSGDGWGAGDCAKREVTANAASIQELPSASALASASTLLDIANKVSPGIAFRLGGLVEDKSVRHGSGADVTFVVTDGKGTVPVQYTGVLPALFREGQGVVALGALDGNGRFVATEVLAKHDEKYMPPEVVDALKRSGHWQEGGT